jgi:hypothetical protein
MREVVESIRWGLEALGHQVDVVENRIANASVNILFGFQLVKEVQMDLLPEDTIVYNLEQMASHGTDNFIPQYAMAARRLQVWDYNPEHLKIWEKWQPRRPPIHMPIAYAPTLTRIPKRRDEYIDVLFYGLASTHRVTTFMRLCEKWLHCVYACGLYGQQRDDLISHSKVVLNLNLYHKSRVFEIARVSYLLANAKAVVSDRHPNSVIEPDMLDALEFAQPEEVPDACLRLANDATARNELERRGQQIFQRRDIRTYLTKALSAGN